jgi:hypothetical protein
MSWRTIALSLAAASLAGCGGPATLPWGETGDILKLSYYRVNTDPRTKKLEPTYRVVMSQSWREYRGDAPGEPFPKAAPGRVYSGFVSDAQMRACFADLTKAGIGTLRASEPESHNPHDLHRKAMNPAESEYTRVITIGTEKWHKSFYYRDQQSGRDLIEAFVKCEKYASAWVQMSILIHSEAVGPAFPKER